MPTGGSGPTRLSVVIPAFNEAGRLPASLLRVYGYLAGTARWLPAEVVVVDDGSSDGTVDSARALAAPPGVELVVVRHDRNRGKGAAVRTGFGASRGELVLLSDADLSSPIAEVESLAQAAAAPSVVIGSRALDRSLTLVRQPWYRDLMGRTFNLITRLLVLPGFSDTQCGFKLFPGPLARALASAQRLDGFAYDVELLALARRWGYPVREVPVRWDHVEASRVRALRHSSQMLRDLLRLAWWRWSGALAPAPPG
jgi:dolichyl-phosphate beta-glucosyltransferase